MTDKDLAEKAKERANRNSTSQFDVVNLLCPVCHEPYFGEDPNPNDFAIDPDDGEYGNDRAAYQYSPQRIADSDHPNPWDKVCVYPVEREFDDGRKLQVDYARHDHSSEAYQAWKSELDELKKIERRKGENQGLGSFAGESDEQ